jgi:hypothetical protein
VENGSVGASGIPTVDPDWTAEARKYLSAAIANNQTAKSHQTVPMPELTEADSAYSAEYQSLFRAVGSSMFTHSYLYKLPSKKMTNGKYRFDWTLGPGARRLGEMGGGNYGLFLYSYDMRETGSRFLMRILVGAVTSYVPPGGMHSAYAALVDLDSGNIVWFNFYAVKKGDVRNPIGAQERADKLLSTFPLREGEAPVKPAAGK